MTQRNLNRIQEATDVFHKAAKIALNDANRLINHELAALVISAPALIAGSDQELPPHPMIEGGKAVAKTGLTGLDYADKGITTVINGVGAVATLGLKTDVGDTINKAEDHVVDAAMDGGEKTGT